MPFTLTNIRRDLEDLGPRFDGAPDLEFRAATKALELAEYETEEGAFPLARLLEADEAFLCSSIREVMPVAAVDGTAFGLGPAAHELQRALRQAAGESR